MDDAMDSAGESHVTQEKRRHVSDLHLAFIAGKAIVKEHARWREPEMKARWDATRASTEKETDAAIFAWTAEEWN